MVLFKGVGVFFNEMEDLMRFHELAEHEHIIDWVTPLMAPEQKSVDENRTKWESWREKLPNVKFVPWIDCQGDPDLDAARTIHVAANYRSDGILLNCEKAYEGEGKWKGEHLCKLLMGNDVTAPLRKILSYPSSPAEIYNMDFRAFERIGCWFAPQAYWNQFPEVPSTPKVLFQSTYLPSQLHVGRDYRLWIDGVSAKHWGRIVEWHGGSECLVKDLVSSKLYRVPVTPHKVNGYEYMTIKPDRFIYARTSIQKKTGKLLGFQAKEKIVPTVGVWSLNTPTPEDVKAKLDEVPGLVGASIYLGETSTSEHVRAVWQSISQ